MAERMQIEYITAVQKVGEQYGPVAVVEVMLFEIGLELRVERENEIGNFTWRNE